MLMNSKRTVFNKIHLDQNYIFKEVLNLPLLNSPSAETYLPLFIYFIYLFYLFMPSWHPMF